MSRSWKGLLILLGAQAALSAAAATLEWRYTCGACEAGGMSLGLAGLGFYGGLLLSALYAGPNRFLFGAILLGFGVHAMLVAQLVALRMVCAICLAAAGVSGVMTILSIACDRANLGRMAAILPWSILLVLGWGEFSRQTAGAATSAPGPVRMVVYTQSDCPYCDEFRDRFLPRAEQEFGPRLQVTFRPAAEMPAIRQTPTILLSRGRRDAPTRVFEGLPPYDALRHAILEAEGRP